MDTKTWDGVQSLLDNYIHVLPDDVVVLLYTSDSYESAAWVSAAFELRQIAVTRLWMAPLVDDGFEARLLDALPSPAKVDGRLVLLSFERDTMSHTATIATALSVFQRDRRAVFRAISASRNLFKLAMHAIPEELSARNTAVLQRLGTATSLRITTRGGSELNVTLDNERHRWVSNRGMARAGGVTILPAGEVATYPASISGTFVADFAFNVNAITDRDARLKAHPVRVTIRDGRAVRYTSDDPKTASFLEECFQKYCAYNVGELGFGTNVGVREPIALNSHINERRPGVHLGFGQHNQDPGVVGYQCAIHLDLIARGGRIWVDDDPTPLDLEHLVPSLQSHPEGPRDEDIFSPELDDIDVDDCCGILTSDGLRLFDLQATPT